MTDQQVDNGIDAAVRAVRQDPFLAHDGCLHLRARRC